MTVSIYHFFVAMMREKAALKTVRTLEDFPFDGNLISCRSAGVFPDMALKLSSSDAFFTGGELIELKDSDSYTVSSFNSTIPTGTKRIADLLQGKQNSIREQMIAAGDEIEQLAVRQVFYLVRGKKRGNIKVVLVHGSFFETVKTPDLITESFAQVLEERLRESGSQIDEATKQMLLTIFSEQQAFSKARNVEKASVKLRFRVMTEVKAEGNVLNASKYPEFGDNTFTLAVPCHDDTHRAQETAKMREACGEEVFSTLRMFLVKHHFNGYFLVFETTL
jgi:hypothetical protein